MSSPTLLAPMPVPPRARRGYLMHPHSGFEPPERLRDATAPMHSSSPAPGAGPLASGIAHDLNNLLAVVTGLSEVLLRALPPDSPVHADADALAGASRAASRLVARLVDVSRSRPPGRHLVKVNDAVGEMRSLLSTLVGARVAVRYALNARRRVPVDATDLLQILSNLAVNARDAMPGGGTLTVGTSDVRLTPEDVLARGDGVPARAYVALAVTDDGVGMDERVQSSAMRPYFTTKGEGSVGLGLATVREIARWYGAHVTLTSAVGTGTTVTVYFPVGRRPAGPQTASAEHRAGGRGETILVVDDHPGVRRAITRALELDGYTVLGAGSGREALDVLARSSEPIDLVVSDVRLPGMDGVELAQQLRRRGDRTPFVLLSGRDARELTQERELPAGIPLGTKPLEPGELERLVRSTLDAHGSADG